MLVSFCRGISDEEDIFAMSLLFPTLKKQRKAYGGFLTVFLLLFFVASVAQVLMLRLTGEMSQTALDDNTDALLRFIGLITIVMVIRAVTSALSVLILGRFGGKAGYRFRDNFAKFFLAKPFKAFEGANSGESLSVLSNDLPNAVQLVSDGGIRMIGDFISLIVTFGYMMIINWWLSLIFFASFPVLIIVQVVISIPIQKKTAKQLAARAEFTAIANDSFQNTSVVAVYGLESVLEARCLDAYGRLIAAEKSRARSLLSLMLAGILASQIPLLILIVFAANQVIYGDMIIAELVAYIALAAQAGDWLTMLSQRSNWVQTNAAGAKRLNEHLDGDMEDIYIGQTLEPLDNIAVSIRDMSFAYSDEEDAPLVLDKFNLQIAKGSRVALIGGSGSGKSTVLKLLLGLYTPKEGQISIFGTDTGTVSLKSLRNVFAYVPQDSFLFPETVGENIVGNDKITDLPRLEKACRDAGILDFIQGLPVGFDSVLAESAENISGGQKQRIALARAFYLDAPIILFDEATSALDPATEAAIFKSFDALAKDKTVIMVAHRASAVEFCDTVIEMGVQ